MQSLPIFPRLRRIWRMSLNIEIPYMSFRRQKTIGEAVDYVLTECLGESLDESGEILSSEFPKQEHRHWLLNLQR